MGIMFGTLLVYLTSIAFFTEFVPLSMVTSPSVLLLDEFMSSQLLSFDIFVGVCVFSSCNVNYFYYACTCIDCTQSKIHIFHYISFRLSQNLVGI